MNNTNNIHNMKSIILALLVATLSFNGHAQTDVEIKKLEGLIERLGAVKTYSEKPAYYLQIDKTECRLLVRVNDIPLGYHFIENEDESVLRPINSLLFGSGKHTIRIEVYPRPGEKVVSENACVNIRVVHCKEQSAGSPQTVAKLDTPADIGARRTALYTDSVSFDAGLPFDHKNILADARDLRTVPGLEKRVLAHYNKVRQMMIDGKYAEYYTTRFITAGLASEMNYWDKDILKEQYLSPDYLFRFQCNPIDWTALPIEDYEMVICGNGELVCLRRKVDFDDVLQVSFYVSEANKVLNPNERVFVSKFILLYMPQGSDELVELY